MASILLCFIWSIATAYSIAFAVWPLLKVGGKRNKAATVLAILGISACPALIPPQHIMPRAFCCLLCVDPLFRVLDFARQLRNATARPKTWRDYWTFLIPFPFLLTVFEQPSPVSSPPQFRLTDVLWLMAHISCCLLALFLCLQSHQIKALRESFPLDHLLKLVLFTAFAESASQIQVLFERLAGFETSPIIHHAYLAQTPAEFWFRYNQRVRRWLYVNVFIPCGGRKTPPTGVLAVFLVSAIFHEFFFALATSRLDGYQFTFFLLQAPAVIVSPRLQRLAARGPCRRLFVRGLTWLWFATLSPLFFHGFGRVFPFFYASAPWLL